MIIVLDTNIIISGIFWKYGNPRKIIDKWREGRIEIAVSKDTVNELIRIMEEEFGITIDEINYWRKSISENSIFVEPLKKHEIVKSHQSDNKFIDVAFEAEAEYIVSGDKHLLEIKNFGKIKIVTASEMVKILG